MFGRRPDGRKVRLADPIVGFTPYIMPQRIDTPVHAVLHIDCDTLTRYIRKQRDDGHIISYMDLVTAAYVRAVSQYPELNRFVVNKQYYARNTICISLTILKTTTNGEIKESTVKLHFDPSDTLYDVHNKFEKAISENRKPDTNNDADKLVRLLLSVPGLPTFFVSAARLMDRYGVLPRYVVNASPFHTGMFITNMASIGMPHVNHHIYNFGTTSLFLAMGKVEKVPKPGADGSVVFNRMIPIGVVADERVTSGASFGTAFTYWRDLLADPTRLEVPPESVSYDFPPEKMPPLIRGRALRRLQKKQARIGA